MACCHDIQFSLIDHLYSHQLPCVDMTTQFHNSKVAPSQRPAQMVEAAEIGATGEASGVHRPVQG